MEEVDWRSKGIELFQLQPVPAWPSKRRRPMVKKCGKDMLSIAPNLMLIVRNKNKLIMRKNTTMKTEATYWIFGRKE